MKRPGRRAPVIAWAIAAAALSGGVGVSTAAPALADDGRPGPAAGTGDSGDDPGPRRHSRGAGATDGSAQDGDGRPGDPCPWWPRPVPQVLPVDGGYSGGNSGLIIPVTPMTPPVSVFGDKPPTPAAGPDALPVVPAFTPAPVAPPAAEYPAPPAAVSRPAPRAVPAAPIAGRPPTPAAVSAVPARVGPPTSRPAPAQGQAATVQPPPPVRLGYPDELRDADLAKVLSTALPGLAAMAGMTALGGLIGYRQARAGYLLRAAGAGRFLQ